MPSEIAKILSRFPRADLMGSQPTPLERLNRLSDQLGIDLWLKRDDLSLLGFGGNKIRQLEFYLGDAVDKGADTILITGAVQSNFVRSAAAAAARCGMHAVLQLEERVADMDPLYHSSGNVLLAQILGAEHIRYPVGEDENGADDGLHRKADELIAEGRKPYVIHLGVGHPPLGSLGYMAAADELIAEMADWDDVVVATGSGSTHTGLLAGLNILRSSATVHGICVRRSADLQRERLAVVFEHLAKLLERDEAEIAAGNTISDAALTPGYGKMGEHTREALTMMARVEGIFLDPVYTAKVFAGLIAKVRSGEIKPGAKVVMFHTGGTPALFGYQSTLAAL